MHALDETFDTFETYRPRLFAIAYRMLGAAMEAEDAVQEAYLRLRAAPTTEIHAPEAYLRRTLIHLCINQLDSARAKRETYPGVWLPEPILTDSALLDPAELLGRAETLSFAFLLMLEQLSPEERAVYVLREAFDYPYSEIASLMGKSEAACRKLYSRARAGIDPSRAEGLSSADAHVQMVGQLVNAMQTGEPEALMRLLSPDVLVRSDGGGKIAAALKPVTGQATAAGFLIGLGRFMKPGDHFEPHLINGLPGGILRLADGSIDTVFLFNMTGDLIRDVYLVRNPDKLRAFIHALG